MDMEIKLIYYRQTIHYTTTLMSHTGYLEIVVGPMYSGKTSYLVELYKKYKYIGKKIMCLNYIDDTRYSAEQLSTHDRVCIPCIFVKQLGDIWDDPKHPEWATIHEADVILINEGQFFTDLKQVVLDMIEVGSHKKVYFSGLPGDYTIVKGSQKEVYVSGLDGDYRRAPFGQILELIPYCDNVVKKAALCAQCRDGTAAPFTHRITDAQEQIVIGTDIYIPLCRKCYTK
jgi:thymidine kinase